VKRLRIKFNLQRKIKLLIYLGITILLLNFPLIYIEINKINHSIIELELTEDLYNTVLDMRRYEKNYLLYHDKESLTSTISSNTAAEALLATKLSKITKPHLAAEYVQSIDRLKTYKSILSEKLKPPSSRKPLDVNTQKTIRSIGKDIVTFADNLLKIERRRITKATHNVLWRPLAFMGAMFLLFLTGAIIVIRKVVKPLATIEKATEKIAKGDFSPIDNPEVMESQIDHLVVAFNRMVQELETRQEQIIHTRKIASLGTLISGTAHELNNPINNIVLTIDTLVGGRKVTEERRAELLDDILRQALRASKIVKNLLDFSRAETTGFDYLNLSEILTETIQIATNQIIISNVRLHEKIATDLPEIKGNRQGLQQVFLNIITNAVQSMQNGGDLTIRVTYENSNKIIVSIQDTGTGIPEEHLPNIFDPFFTTKEVGKGTGLGLSVSFGLIKKHGGQILVESKIKKGTTFTVVLPVFKNKTHG
jgi:two-component system NtrC family sensor kinase